MTVHQFEDILYVQSPLQCLPDPFNSFKTSIRLSAALTPDQVRTKFLAEDAAITAMTSYFEVARGAVLNVGEKKYTLSGCPNPNDNNSDK